MPIGNAAMSAVEVCPEANAKMYGAVQRFGVMPCAVNHDQLLGTFGGRKFTQQFGIVAGVQHADTIGERERFESPIEVDVVLSHQITTAKRLVDDAGGIERMKTLAAMLQNQHIGLVVDGGNCITKTGVGWPETAITAWFRVL